MATIFSVGDTARYEGDALSSWTVPLCPGDVVRVTQANDEDEDDDVHVTFRGSHYYVSAHDLVWLPATDGEEGN